MLSSANGSYDIEFYISNQCPNANQFQEGGTVLASSEITLSCATATENCTVGITVPVTNAFLGPNGTLLGKYVTTLVRDEENNTSEFSACELYVLGANIFKNGFE